MSKYTQHILKKKQNIYKMFTNIYKLYIQNIYKTFEKYQPAGPAGPARSGGGKVQPPAGPEEELRARTAELPQRAVRGVGGSCYTKYNKI